MEEVGPQVVPDEVRRLRLEPGDRLLVRCTHLTPQQQVEYRDYLQAHFPGNEVFVIVADEIAVESAAPEPQRISATGTLMSDEDMDRFVEKICRRFRPPPAGGVKTLLR